MIRNKKNIVLALLICMACLCLSACGVADEENILEKICDANSNSALQEKGKILAFRADIYDAEGNTDSSYAYLDPDRVVYESADRTEINEKGDIYGYDNYEKNVYRYLFLDDSAEYYSVEATGYSPSSGETVLSVNKNGRNLIVRTQEKGEGNLANMEFMMIYYGYDVPETFSIINEYVLDPKTYEIKCYNVYANFGKKDFLLIKNERVDNPEVYKVDTTVIDAINAENSRVVTIIADPGTGNETTYKQTIAKGCIIHVGLSSEHSFLYTDEACTQEYVGGADLNDDLMLYTKHN